MPFYAVKVGRKTGVYKTWEGCSKQVTGFPGAVFKKFNNYADAYFFAVPFKPGCSKLSKQELEELANTGLLGSDDEIIIDPESDCNLKAEKPDGAAVSLGNTALITDFNKKDSFSLYTDGACSGNPGKGGYGYAVVHNNALIVKGSGGLLATTNNQMELTAVIEGLKEIPEKYSVVVYSDSSYVVNAFNKDWITGWKSRDWYKSNGEPVANRELWESLLSVIDMHSSVRFVWVKGHAGNKYNELCDQLAVKAIGALKE